MTPESTRLRDLIREGIIGPCQHSLGCGCPQRKEWDSTVERIYALERAAERVAT